MSRAGPTPQASDPLPGRKVMRGGGAAARFTQRDAPSPSPPMAHDAFNGGGYAHRPLGGGASAARGGFYPPHSGEAPMPTDAGTAGGRSPEYTAQPALYPRPQEDTVFNRTTSSAGGAAAPAVRLSSGPRLQHGSRATPSTSRSPATRVVMQGEKTISAQSFPAVMKPVGIISGGNSYGGGARHAGNAGAGGEDGTAAAPPPPARAASQSPTAKTGWRSPIPAQNSYGMGQHTGRYTLEARGGGGNGFIESTSPRRSIVSARGGGGGVDDGMQTPLNYNTMPRPRSTVASPQPSLAQALQDLAALHEQGGLTDDEYAAAKYKVLRGEQQLDPHNRTLASLLDSIQHRSQSPHRDGDGGFDARYPEVVEPVHPPRVPVDDDDPTWTHSHSNRGVAGTTASAAVLDGEPVPAASPPPGSSEYYDVLQKQELQLRALVEENSALRAEATWARMGHSQQGSPVWEREQRELEERQLQEIQQQQQQRNALNRSPVPPPAPPLPMPDPQAPPAPMPSTAPNDPRFITPSASAPANVATNANAARLTAPALVAHGAANPTPALPTFNVSSPPAPPMRGARRREAPTLGAPPSRHAARHAGRADEAAPPADEWSFTQLRGSTTV